MDNVATLDLNLWISRCINHIQLFLQVNMLSKIADHSGTTLLSHVLTPPSTNWNNQISDLLESLLQWPNQPSLAPKHGSTGSRQYKSYIDTLTPSNLGTHLAHGILTTHPSTGDGTGCYV